jgi:Xaa-Pro aminopeptidase
MPTAILLTGDSESNQNLYYRTRFLAEGLVYLEADGRGELLLGSMEKGRAEKEAQVSTVRTWDEFDFREVLKETNDRNQAFLTVLGRAAKETGADGLVVDSSFPAYLADSLRSSGMKVEVDPSLLTLERRRKTPEEIAAIEEAQRATERSAARAVEILRASEEMNGCLHYNGVPLTAERLRLEVELSLVKDGMDVSASPIVAGGPGAADPHWLGYGPLRAGEAIVMDIFPRSKRTRYWADMTRTVVRGQPSELLLKMYDAVLRAHEAALSCIKAGANGHDAHAAVEEVFAEAGFAGEGSGPRYTHGTGHGVGLDIHEAPGLGMTDVELLENDVVTVEPGLYDPAVGGIRIEDLVVVTKDGYRNLTQFPKEFQI